VLFISRDITEAMKRHAREEYPLECCGMLAGKENVITRIFKTRNSAASMDKYEIDPVEQLNVFEEIDRLSLKLLGVYHSHPNHPCYPSGFDISRAFYPDTAFFIISLSDVQPPQIKAFSIKEGKVMEEEFEVR
jgi:proteasome lid subunit RPN8/RPN11